MDSTLHYTSVNHADSLMRSINHMRLDSDLCDVVLVVGGFRIKAHRIILSASAPYFYQLFQSSEIQSAPLTEYHVHNVDETSALKIIEFCYTSTISLDADSVWPLFSAAIKFECSEISGLCCDFLTSELSIATCLNTLIMAARYNNCLLVTSAGRFVMEHIDQLYDSPLLLDLTATQVVQVVSHLHNLTKNSQEVVQLLTAWLDHNSDHQQQVVLQLTGLMPTFSPDLQKYVNSCGIADQHQKNSKGQSQGDSKNTGVLSVCDIEMNEHHKWTKSDKKGSKDVPLHICAWCGDAFDTGTELSQHQKLCTEAALPAGRKQEVLEQDGEDNKSDNIDNGKDSPESVPGIKSELSHDLRSHLSDGKDTGSGLTDIASEHLAASDLLSKPEGPFHSLPSSHKSIFGILSEKYGQSDSKVHEKINTSHEVSVSQSEQEKVKDDQEKLESTEGLSQFLKDDTTSQVSVCFVGDASSRGESKHRKEKRRFSMSRQNDPNNNDHPSSQKPQKVTKLEQSPSMNEGQHQHVGIDDDDDGSHVTNDGSKSKHLLSSIDKTTSENTDSSSEKLSSLKCQLCGQTCREGETLAKHWKAMHGLDLQWSPRNADDNSSDEGGWTRKNGISNKKLKKAYCSRSKINENTGDEKKDSKTFTLPMDQMQLSGEINPGNELAEFMNFYLQQYHHFTKWCLQHGPVFCHLCLIYHPKGSSCPKSELQTGQVAQPESNGNSYCPSAMEDTINDDDDAEGPLDMTKGSQGFPASFHSKMSSNLSVNSDLVLTSPIDMPDYYTNYAHFMAAAMAGCSQKKDNFSLLYPDILTHLGPVDLTNGHKYIPGLPPAGSYPLNLTPTSRGCETDSSVKHQNKSNTLPTSPVFGEGVAVSGSVKRKVSSRQGFPCTVCNRVFAYQAALFTHMRTHSPSGQAYQCQLCHQSFSRAPDLKLHTCPNGVEKPYNCSSCGQTFAKNIHLKRHLATHSGLKPYPCWVCGKRFSRSDHLKRHTQSIHAGSRPHGCHICGKEFVRKYELNKHLLIHNDP